MKGYNSPSIILPQFGLVIRTGPALFRREIPWDCWCGASIQIHAVLHQLSPRVLVMKLEAMPSGALVLTVNGVRELMVADAAWKRRTSWMFPEFDDLMIFPGWRLGGSVSVPYRAGLARPPR